MLYALLKIYAQLAIRIYCRKIVISRPEVLSQEGPLLLACNHPNSFLDGMILTTLFRHPVYSLARGDAFRQPWVDRLLRGIRLLPVYRTSEGVENLEHNYTTFAACRRTFKKNGIVLIFSEGRCENEWHLRPLKKGTARLALAAWKEDTPLRVIPTAINYSSFRNFGKEVHIYFSDPIDPRPVLSQDTEGKQLLAFNKDLRSSLEKTVYEIAPGEKEKRKKIFGIGMRASFALLLLPALAGWLLHAPFYYPVKFFSLRKFAKSGHYDSVVTALLLLTYPVYLFLLVLIGLSLLGAWSLLIVLVSPFTAWACVQAKYQVDA